MCRSASDLMEPPYCISANCLGRGTNGDRRILLSSWEVLPLLGAHGWRHARTHHTWHVARAAATACSELKCGAAALCCPHCGSRVVVGRTCPMRGLLPLRPWPPSGRRTTSGVRCAAESASLHNVPKLPRLESKGFTSDIYQGQHHAGVKGAYPQRTGKRRPARRIKAA